MAMADRQVHESPTPHERDQLTELQKVNTSLQETIDELLANKAGMQTTIDGMLAEKAEMQKTIDDMEKKAKFWQKVKHHYILAILKFVAIALYSPGMGKQLDGDAGLFTMWFLASLVDLITFVIVERHFEEALLRTRPIV